MINLHAKLKKMGNSLGIIVPSDIISKEDMKEGEELNVNIDFRKSTTVGDMLKEARRQKLKFKRSTQEILDEIDEDSG